MKHVLEGQNGRKKEMNEQGNTYNQLDTRHGTEFSKKILFDESIKVDQNPRRGRAAGINPNARFEAQSRHVFDDGWDNLQTLEPLKTNVQIEQSRSIIMRNTSPDVPFDRSINPYRGCEHGCIYCFARPSHAYMGLSAGLDFETRLFAKPNAAQLLKRELSKPGYRPRSIAIGTNTDPYQPIEKNMRIMRQLLELLAEVKHPVTIVTKSVLVLRDRDILSEMARDGLVRVMLSITTIDRKLSRMMEPRASTPTKRLEAIKSLSDAGIPTSVMLAPVIPGLNDFEIERILDSAHNAGAEHANYILIRLPREVSPLFRDWLLRNYPDRYRHVMSLIRSIHNGKDYDVKFNKRMRGVGPYAWQIGRRFDLACKRLGLQKRVPSLRIDLFNKPEGENAQLSLL